MHTAALNGLRRHKPSRWHDQRGFSIVETLVATALLAIALMPIAYMQSSGTRAGVASYQFIAASAIAVDLEDKMRSIPYEDDRLAATSGYVNPDGTLSNANPLAPDRSTWSACAPNKCGYTRTWKITDNTPLPNTKRIDVQVAWTEYGINRTFVLSTIKAAGS